MLKPAADGAAADDAEALTALDSRTVHRLAGWYGAAYFASILLKTTYSTYTVQLFLQAYGLPLPWFYSGQAVLGAWNAVDDSLMAMLASYIHRGPTPALRHLKAYVYGAPLLCGSFLIPFFPWSRRNPLLQGLHYFFAICFWDAAISYVSVSHSALGTDMSGELRVRTWCKRYEIAALGAMSMAIGLSSRFWDPADLALFRWFILAIAAASFLIMQLASMRLHAAIQHQRTLEASAAKARLSARANGVNTLNGNHENGIEKGAAAKDESTVQLLKDAAANRNFRRWLMMQFCVYCNTVFQTKFFIMFSSELFQGTWAQGSHGVFLSASHILRSVLSFTVVLPAVERYGIYTIFRTGCWVQLVVSACGLALAHSVPMLLPLLFVTNLVFTSHKIVVGMFIGDLTDEDLVLHQRSQPMSSFFFAVRSFFTVWADSLVPMAVVWVLVHTGNMPTGASEEKAEEVCSGEGDQQCTAGHNSTGNVSSARHVSAVVVMQALWWLLPLGLATAQLLLMKGFTLHGQYLESIKRRRRQLMEGQHSKGD